jgi:hypothetical protein
MFPVPFGIACVMAGLTGIAGYINGRLDQASIERKARAIAREENALFVKELVTQLRQPAPAPTSPDAAAANVMPLRPAAA